MPAKIRPIHPDFQELLSMKSKELIKLYKDARAFLLEMNPDAVELVYHTHALTSVYSLSDKLGDAYCMLPIYTAHVNLGFNQGSQLPDPGRLLTGTGTLIRHIDINEPSDYRNDRVMKLVNEAIMFAQSNQKKPSSVQGITISKIKLK